MPPLFADGGPDVPVSENGPYVLAAVLFVVGSVLLGLWATVAWILKPPPDADERPTRDA